MSILVVNETRHDTELIRKFVLDSDLDDFNIRLYIKLYKLSGLNRKVRPFYDRHIDGWCNQKLRTIRIHMGTKVSLKRLLQILAHELGHTTKENEAMVDKYSNEELGYRQLHEHDSMDCEIDAQRFAIERLEKYGRYKHSKRYRRTTVPVI